MKIGLFMTPQWRPDADLATGMNELLEQARTARDCGFSSLLVGQHMVTGPEMQMFQTVPLMARLLPEIEGMQIGPGVLLLSMVNPVMVAEEGATLDWMSDGHYVLAGGLGYRQEEFEALGAKKVQRVSRLEESVEVIKRLWTEDRITHRGRHYALTDAGSSVRPKQQPRPPIWLGGDVEAAVRRAARIADAWLGSPTASLEQLQGLLKIYRNEREKAELPFNACPMIRECFIGANKSEVDAVRTGPLLYKYKAYASWGHNDTSDDANADTDTDAVQTFADNFENFCTNRFMLGEADLVADEIRRYGETLETDNLILRLQWPGMAHSDAVQNIRRTGEIIARL